MKRLATKRQTKAQLEARVRELESVLGETVIQLQSTQQGLKTWMDMDGYTGVDVPGTDAHAAWWWALDPATANKALKVLEGK